MAILISAHTLNSRFSQLIIAVIFLFGVVWLFASTFDRRLSAASPAALLSKSSPTTPSRPRAGHPIDNLIHAADKDFKRLLKRETRRMPDAAKAYRERRGRHPPPGFDRWFVFAQAHGALIIEDFFDQIYDDLAPFWGASPNQIRNQANSFENRVSIRDLEVYWRTYDGESRRIMDVWTTMLQEIISRDGWLPDVDLPVNIMDENRVVAKWEDVEEHMSREQESRTVVDKDMLRAEFLRLEVLDRQAPGAIDPIWHANAPYWNLALVGCHPLSPARRSYLDDFDYSHPPPLDPGFPDYSYFGYVQNWTLARSPCDNPRFQGLHGAFVEPISISTTSKMIPMFSGSKQSVNNDIILPAPMYWDEDQYSSGDYDFVPWEKKQDKLWWRGEASGGRNREPNWAHFHRHRFVSMVNETTVRLAEFGEQPPNFILPDPSRWQFAVHKKSSPNGTLADWVGSWSDVSLNHLLCFPDDDPPFCAYTDPYFSVDHELVPYDRQFEFKYLPDIDGNGFSPRLPTLLNSNSLPIKATVYQDWYDARLMPWKHFVPMDNSFMDFYGIMDFFLGNQRSDAPGHDALAQAIATSGKEWMHRVMRREDMLIYMYRLVLEYARICQDSRYKMGWAADL